MCPSSRVITALVNGKTQWQMFMLRYCRHVAAHSTGKLFWNLSETFLPIIIIRMKTCTDLNYGEVALYEDRSCAMSQILASIYWTMTTFLFLLASQWKAAINFIPGLHPTCTKRSVFGFGNGRYECERWNKKNCWAFKPAMSERDLTPWTDNLVFLKGTSTPIKESL